MLKKLETKAASIRLTLEHWSKLRWLMRWHGGRQWLERLIDREYKRRGGK